MRADITGFLRCPFCRGGLTPAGAALRCPAGHSFDVARQGYVNLLTGAAPPGGDTAGMLAARAELIAAGHLDVVTQAIREAAIDWYRKDGFVLDVGAGTGQHLAGALESWPDALGLALDSSKAAARRAASAHPRAGSAVVDAWRGLPIADGCVDLLLNVFAPRNGAEFARVLRPDGLLLVITPVRDHLAELVSALGLIGVDPRKEERVDRALGKHFQSRSSAVLLDQLALTPPEAQRFVAMGPSAWHTDPGAVAAGLAALGDPVRVTAAVRATWYTLA